MTTSASSLAPTLPNSLKACAHCGTLTQSDSSTAFCCGGCHAVYTLLHQRGLEDFYKIRSTTSGDGVQNTPVLTEIQSYKYLDDGVFLEKYSENNTMKFYLEGIHCTACLWLIEKLPSFTEGLLSAQLNFGESIVTIVIDKNGNFSNAASQLARLGYKPHPIFENAQARQLQRKENRTALVRIGVAAFCTGNIMLLAISQYAGADISYQHIFSILSAILFLPIATYCAIPFYRSAIASIKNRNISIDVPIVMALILGTIVSYFNVLTKREHIYFDSLSALLFLLSASRYSLKRIQQRLLTTSHLSSFFTPNAATRIDFRDRTKTEEVSVYTLKRGDRILVTPTDVIPCDGVLRSPTGYINCAWMTGESFPQKKIFGDAVLAGTIVDGSSIEIEVQKSGSETELSKLLSQIEQGSKNKASVISLADRISKWFLAVVLILALGCLILAPSLVIGIHNALSLLIVTCPCALALATPITMSLALSHLARKGLLLKGSDTIEKLTQIKTIAFDKTGTITEGALSVIGIRYFENQNTDEMLAIARSLENKSKHPIGKAILRDLESRKIDQVFIQDQKEIPGVGVFGNFLGSEYSIRALQQKDSNLLEEEFPQCISVGLYKIDKLMLIFFLGDKLRDDAKESIRKIQEMGFKPYLLSGDSFETAQSIGQSAGIDGQQIHSRITPKEKEQFVKAFPKTFMIGDGANDALALSSSYVSAAVQGSIEVSLRSSDIYVTKSGIKPIVYLLTYSKQVMHLIYLNFFLSLIYNSIAATLSITGKMSPLTAALIMPLSSFTVLFTSLIGTQPRKKNL